ncbi:colanic acid exporter [Tritonibacter multivorans]|uniref:Colanic acid exporter n=2 Tax=Tritonibacter multivorans TaxID=928856 RepID=A0A0P1GB80_9RHOB|nr:colanic acid exporter [Tritonibacter multivorans]SFD68350.1 Membrane protein involved in the export of O-antigen and teichoic acid [Tritonibacter multivorans]
MAVISVLGLGSQQFAALMMTLLAAATLSAAEYGVYTLAVVFAEFVVMLTYTGFFHYVINADEDEDRLLPTVFWIMVSIGAVGGALIGVNAALIAQAFDAPQLTLVLQLLAILQPFGAMIGWCTAVLTRHGKMKPYFLCIGFSNLGALALGAATLMIWPSVLALVLYRAARIALCLFSMCWVMPTGPRLRFDVQLARRAARFAWGLYGSASLKFVSNFGADLMLAWFLSTAEAGLYRFANRLAFAASSLVTQPLNAFALKKFGRASRQGKDISAILAQFFAASIVLVGGVAMTIVVLGDQLVTALFRPEFSAATFAIVMMALRSAFSVGHNLIGPVFSALHRNATGMAYNLVVAALMVVVIPAFAPFGLNAMATATTMVQLFSIPFALFVIARWGQLDIGPALRDGTTALGLVACYSAVLFALSFQFNLGSAMLTVNAALAVLLGAITVLLAVRFQVLKPEILTR